MNDAIIVQCEQGSEQWFMSRSGAITASHFKEARGKLKRASKGKKAGDWSDAAENYAFTVAVERITGEPFQMDKFATPEMKRGNTLEPLARARHAMEIGQSIEQIGIVISADKRFAASPDGFIGDDGGSEYKCLVAASSLRPVLFNEDLSDYMDQIQGGMWLCDRDWWDFVVYAPQLEMLGLDFIRKRVVRDQSYINALVNDLEDFDILVEQTKQKLLKISAEGWCDTNANESV